MRASRLFTAILAGAVALAGLALTPGAAEAHGYYRYGYGPPRYYYRPPPPPPPVYYVPRPYYRPPPPPVYYAPRPWYPPPPVYYGPPSVGFGITIR